MLPELSQLITVDADQVLASLNARADGLNAAEVAARQKRYGLNVIHTHKLNSWKILWRQVTSNPLVLVLLVATVVSYATGSHISAYYIFALIAASIILGFWNEYAAERTVGKLLKRVSLSAIVVRGGDKLEIPVEQLTIGDIVLLAPGSIVPADLRLVETGGLQIDQSVLTGESEAVSKSAEALAAAKTNFADYTNAALMGTVVTTGAWGGLHALTDAILGCIEIEGLMAMAGETKFVIDLKIQDHVTPILAPFKNGIFTFSGVINYSEPANILTKTWHGHRRSATVLVDVETKIVLYEKIIWDEPFL